MTGDNVKPNCTLLFCNKWEPMLCDKLGMMINIWNAKIGKKVIRPIRNTVSPDNIIWGITHLDIMKFF